MKDHSIGAALQAWTTQAPASQHSARQVAKPVTSARPASPAVRLTRRQLEVLVLLCEGLPNKVICRRLNIATGTVKVHISCILRELGVTSRLQAVVAAGSLGISAGLVAATLEQPAGAIAAGQLVRYSEEHASGRVAAMA